MNAVSQQELDISAKLYGLLGALSAEIAQLPTERTIRSWSQNETREAVSRAKDATIDALRCALRLSQLGEIDEVSRGFIAEILRYSEEDVAQLAHVEETLIHECWSGSMLEWRTVSTE